jgi:microcin C transport system substrate-binding protein
MLWRYIPKSGQSDSLLLIFLSLIFFIGAKCLASPNTEHSKVWKHAAAVLSSPKYPPNFPYFDYVNPDSPKGGNLNLGSYGTFDNLNIFPSEIKGNLESGISYIYDTLLVPSQDEVSISYGLLAESLAYSPDFSWVAYKLRPEAHFHDGHPVTPEDVIFSFQSFIANSPTYASYWRDVARVEKTGEREVTFFMRNPGNREMPQILGQLMILPKHWWEGQGADGKSRDIRATTLEIPLGSGPYALESINVGRSALYRREPTYWGQKLNVNRGHYNFDRIRIDYYRDLDALFEAFKAGDIHFRQENIAKMWATSYTFDAVRQGRVVLETFPVRDLGRMQAFAFNLRKEAFQDIRVRQALNLVLNFEEMNKTLFYNQYLRINSYFFDTELAARGRADDAEKQIFNRLTASIPPQVFSDVFSMPVNRTPEEVRLHLKQALSLLQEAGYTPRNGRLISPHTGQPFEIEYLGRQSLDSRFILSFQKALERLGISLIIRLVDDSQYQSRIRDFEFDMTMTSWVQSLSPGNELRNYFGSAAANQQATRNIGGIQNPAVDELIEKIVHASTREALVTAVHALDRVMLWNYYVIPLWSSDTEKTARWDKFVHPKNMPLYGESAFPHIWWSKQNNP